MRRSRGLSVLEVVIAAAILSTLAIPAFELFSLQGHQVAGAQRDLALHDYALQRLAEEESRQVMGHWSGERTASRAVRPPGQATSVAETLSVAPVPACTGLWRLDIDLAYADESTRGVTRRIAVSRLVVDRDVPARLPVGWR